MATVTKPGLGDVRTLLESHDSLGVVTLTLAIADTVAPGRAAVRAVEAELNRLRSLAGADGHTPASVLSELQGLLIRPAHGPGTRGLAAVAGLASGTVTVLEFGTPLTTRLTVGTRAAVRAILLALEEIRPVGAVFAAHDGVRLLELEAGALHEVWAEQLPELEGRTLAGPAHAHPRGAAGAAPGSLVGVQRDLFEKRTLTEEQRFMTAAAGRVAEEARSRGWCELVVGDDPRLAAALTRGLVELSDVTLIPGLRLAQRAPHATLEPQLTVLVERARARSQRAVAQAVLDDDAGGGRGAVGVDEVARALNAGRVETLVVHPTATVRGRSNPSGEVAGETPRADDPAGLADDEMLAEALVARALATGADVIVALPEVAADELASEPVLARLRWA